MDTADAFDATFTEYHGRLVRHLARILRDPVLAQDLAQETLLRVHAANGRLRNPEARTVWIYRIASNLALDHLRRRRGAGAPWPAVPESEDPGDDGATPASEDPSAEDRLERQEMAACIRGHIDGLPETLRAPLMLRDVEGLGEEAVAAILGCSVGAMKVRTHRARKRLRERLDRSCHVYQDRRGVLLCESADGQPA